MTDTSDGKFTCPTVEYTSETKDQFKPAYSAGQIIFVEDTGRIYLDFHNHRRCYTPDISGLESQIASLSHTTKFIGTADGDPTLGNVTIGGKAISPNIGDIVSFGKKEYLYRKGELGETWYEIGDEDEMTWAD